jgi:hypothetical protein
VGLLVKTVTVVHIKITVTLAMMPVKAVSVNLVDKLDGKKGRTCLSKNLLHLDASDRQNPGAASVPAGGAVSSFSTVVSNIPIVPLRS